MSACITYQKYPTSVFMPSLPPPPSICTEKPTTMFIPPPAYVQKNLQLCLCPQHMYRKTYTYVYAPSICTEKPTSIFMPPPAYVQKNLHLYLCPQHMYRKTYIYIYAPSICTEKPTSIFMPQHMYRKTYIYVYATQPPTSSICTKKYYTYVYAPLPQAYVLYISIKMLTIMDGPKAGAFIAW